MLKIVELETQIVAVCYATRLSPPQLVSKVNSEYKLF
jgi:hypothetical protein